jgi:hypothetical protein
MGLRGIPNEAYTADRSFLGNDLSTAADVASAHAHFRFVIAEVADALPHENPAKRELLELIGKQEG